MRAVLCTFKQLLIFFNAQDVYSKNHGQKTKVEIIEPSGWEGQEKITRK